MIDSPSKTDLLSLTPAELTAFFQAHGEPAFRARQVFSWFHRGIGFAGMTNLPRALREKLNDCAYAPFPTVEKKLVSKIDGTIKYLFTLHDGESVESVVMQYHHGNTICVSSQVGCRMGCRFCASTLGGKIRDLAASEILGQVLIAQNDSGLRISNIVMMGIGEPLDNYDNVIRFLRLVGDPAGIPIGYRHISLSTCGVVNRIYDLAKEQFPITLSISLHAATDAERGALMPINQKWNISQLLTACRAYFEATGRRISFEYTLIAGKNDTIRQANILADTLHRYLPSTMPLHVNLIPLNEVAERPFSHSDAKQVEAFAQALSARKINATVRRRLGPDINASCGQLRRAQMQTPHAGADSGVPTEPFPSENGNPKENKTHALR